MEGVQGANKPQVAVQPYLSTRQYSTLGAVAAVVFSLTAVAFAAIAHRVGLSTVATAIVAAGGGLLTSSLASLLLGAAVSKRKSLVEQFHDALDNKAGSLAYGRRDYLNSHLGGAKPNFEARTEEDLRSVIDEYAGREPSSDGSLYIRSSDFKEPRALAAAVIGASMAHPHIVILGILERVTEEVHVILNEPAVSGAKSKEELARALAQGIEQ